MKEIPFSGVMVNDLVEKKNHERLKNKQKLTK